jgi:hypothetical protein
LQSCGTNKKTKEKPTDLIQPNGLEPYQTNTDPRRDKPQTEENLASYLFKQADLNSINPLVEPLKNPTNVLDNNSGRLPSAGDFEAFASKIANAAMGMPSLQRACHYKTLAKGILKPTTQEANRIPLRCTFVFKNAIALFYLDPGIAYLNPYDFFENLYEFKIIVNFAGKKIRS